MSTRHILEYKREYPLNCSVRLKKRTVDHLSNNDTIQLDVKSSPLKIDNFIFNEDSDSEMYHKTTREFMQKLRAVVKF
jgi:hypothetical protein